MKFFWKIFCSTIIITAFTCSAGGYYLIRSQFHLSLDREIAAAYSENAILWQIMDEELKDLTSMKEEVPDIADNITVNVSGGSIPFAVMLCVLFAGVGLVSFIVSSLLLSPLKKLSSATKQMADGSFRQQLNISRNDEVGELASDFEQMSVKLEEMVNELKEYSRRQKDFVDNFSHELKTPLTSIIGYADMIRSKEMEPERRMACADYIYTEGKRLEMLSLKLMDLIVLEKQDFTFRPVHMREFLGQVADAFSPVVSGSGISFSARIQDTALRVEPDLMKTVCMNLLDNARKAVDYEGSIVLTGRKIPNGAYCISVEDNGKGIPKEEISRITEAFYMVDKSRARAQGGAGMGLALCSRIIELHRGRMKFVSRVGRGTRVSVYLRAGRRAPGDAGERRQG
ncbi:sensor histidine kinase [Dorea sp. D27]|uniref:sensor histidine kinase n=1 Tax=Dorea sp. D27 TaxID=658665 RepID=UPI0006738059|nr:HAMP domain-containing sensor histidine kinase [Dorea sp. D27]KMZ55573.1 putative sensor histidine kinase ResE [Dorea sp. D27]